MKLESIYKEYVEIFNENDDFQLIKYLKLKEKLEQAIREESCYKRTSKTRITAIKRIVKSVSDSRPALKGYGVFGDYKVITDTYHLIAIKDDVLPLKLVTTDKDLIEKVGKQNVIQYTFPNCEHFLNTDYSKLEEITVDCDDILAYYKMNHSSKNKDQQLYTIKDNYYNINYLKNIIDILGTNIKVYYSGSYAPLYFVNESGEIGLGLPVKKY